MDLSSRADDSTTASVPRAPRRSALAVRAVTTSLLAVFVLAGALGLFGERSRVETATAGGVELSLTYPSVARAGMNVPWRIEVTDPAGLPTRVELEIDASYFELFEHQRFYPEPAEEHRGGDTLVMTFDTGGAPSLVVTHDAYLQPRYSAARSGSVALRSPDRPPLTVEFRTVVLP